MFRNYLFAVVGILLTSFAGSSACVAADTATIDPSLDPRLRFTSEQLREDLIYLRDVWAPQDRSFTLQRRDDFNKAISQAIADADRLDYPEFWMRIAHAVALSGNGHTTVYSSPFAKLPIRMWWFADGFFVVRAEPDQAELLGARIEKIGSLTTEQALSRVMPYISGNARRIRAMSADFLETPLILKHANITTDSSATELTLRLRNGTVRHLTLPIQSMRDPDEFSADYWGVLMPSNTALPGRWSHVLDSVAIRSPTYEPIVDLSSSWLGDDKRVLYIRSNQVSGMKGDDGALAAKFYSILNGDVLQGKPRAVIVDLRFNSGGNFFNAILFAQALPKLLPVKSKTFVLVGSCTFSAAIVTAAMLKGHGGANVLLVGTPMGDDDHFFAEGQPVTLPNTKTMVRPATGYQDWAKGCSDLNVCYWPNVVYGQSNVSLNPELQVDTTFSEYAAGHDPVLAAALTATK